MAKRTNRAAWGLAVVLAMGVLAGAGSLVAHSAQLSSSDRAALASLRRAVADVESWEAPTAKDLARFEQLAPRSRVPTWRRLQRRLPSSRPGSADLAFVLAYYGIDYQQNLQRLLLPYRRWRKGSSSEREQNMLEALPTDLLILYLKHHDVRSLGALLDLQLDGAPAEVHSSVLAALWDPVRMLRLSDGSPVRIANIGGMLLYVSDLDRKAAAKEVRPFIHHRDPRVARAARKVLQWVMKPPAAE
jgi:hypothetical protein